MGSVKSAVGIGDIKPFQNIAETSRSVLARGLRYVSYAKAASVLRKGQPVSGAYIVVSGRLRVFTLSPDGKEATLYLIHPGETCVLALNCIFSDLLYPAWVEASAATRVAVISGADFRILFESEPSVRNMTVQAFSTVVFRLMAELEQIHSYKLERRLTSFLLLHASGDGKVRSTQQEIASHLGTTREVVARALGHLATAGHVQSRRNQITLKDPAGLAEWARRGETRRKHGNVAAVRKR